MKYQQHQSDTNNQLRPEFIMLAVALPFFIYLIIHQFQQPSTKTTFQPPKARIQNRTFVPDGSNKGERVPEEWITKTHRAAPGDDWRAIEAASIRQMIGQGGSLQTAAFSGSWQERGPSNIPGRIVDIKINYASGQMYAISDHGIIFRSDDLQGNGWTALNDRFPLGLGVASKLEIFPGGYLLSCGWIKADNNWGIYYSDDNGQSWTASAGLSGFPLSGIKRLASQGDTVYLFVQEYDQPNVTDYYTIYQSIDQGQNFTQLYQSPIPVGDGGRHNKSDMWVSNEASDSCLYLMLEDSLFLVSKFSGARTFNSIISNGPVENGLLTGLTKNGVTELTAYISANGAGNFYAWRSGDSSWTYKGQMTDWWLAFPFGPNSFSCSAMSADTLYFGGILTSISTDRGASWTTMDMDSTNSYALYHGDVPKSLSTINPATNKEEVYLGTDGGIYKLDSTGHFNSLSIPGLKCTQIYKMVSRHAYPGTMFIGTQDNGYAHTFLGTTQPGVVDFTFQWGGDVTNAASGDGGNSFWLWWLGDGCNYMTGPTNVPSNWSPHDFDGGVPYWEAPIWVSSHFPDRCYTAGFLNNNPGNYLIKIQANPGNQAIPTQYNYNFEANAGGKISAISISPIDSNYFYVATENGYFLSSSDGGNSWTKTHLSTSMYPRVIHPSQKILGEVWVGGSGYSNSPVFYTTNHGLTFTPLNAGMPACRVEAFATNEHESIIFAATSIGPFAWDVTESSWADISGGDAPLVHYMDVEYIPSIQTARFATYARGVWDFQFMTTSVAQTLDKNPILSIYPIPAEEHITVHIHETLIHSAFRITNSSGQMVKRGIFESPEMRINISMLPAGVYFLRTIESNSIPEKFIRK